MLREEVTQLASEQRAKLQSMARHISSHSRHVTKAQRYQWCRDAGASLYWAWGSLCLAAVSLLPWSETAPPPSG